MLSPSQVVLAQGTSLDIRRNSAELCALQHPQHLEGSDFTWALLEPGTFPAQGLGMFLLNQPRPLPGCFCAFAHPLPWRYLQRVIASSAGKENTDRGYL